MTQDKQEPKVDCKDCAGRGWNTAHEGKVFCNNCGGTGKVTDHLAALQQRVRELRKERQGFIEKIGELLDSNLNFQEQLRDLEAENARLKENVEQLQTLATQTQIAYQEHENQEIAKVKVKMVERVKSLESQLKPVGGWEEIAKKLLETYKWGALCEREGYYDPEEAMEAINQDAKALTSQKGETK